MAMLLPQAQGKAGAPPPPENRRLAQALFRMRPRLKARHKRRSSRCPDELERTRADAANAISRRYGQEWAQAKRVLARLRPFFETRPTRRHRSAARRPGRLARSLRARARSEAMPFLRFEKPRQRVAPLNLLARYLGLG